MKLEPFKYYKIILPSPVLPPHDKIYTGITQKTICLCIGNTDNKLTQQEWSEFTKKFIKLCGEYADVILFAGGPPNYSNFQNYCIILKITTSIEAFRFYLTSLRVAYRQDSISWMEGETEFI